MIMLQQDNAKLHCDANYAKVADNMTRGLKIEQPNVLPICQQSLLTSWIWEFKWIVTELQVVLINKEQLIENV